MVLERCCTRTRNALAESKLEETWRCGNKHKDCRRAPESQSPTPSYKAETSTKGNRDLNNLEPGGGYKHNVPRSEWGQLRGVWVMSRIKSSQSPCVSGTRVSGAASSSSYHHRAPAEMLSVLLHLNSVTRLLRVPTKTWGRKVKSKEFFLGWLHAKIGKISSCLSTSSFKT